MWCCVEHNNAMNLLTHSHENTTTSCRRVLVLRVNMVTALLCSTQHHITHETVEGA